MRAINFWTTGRKPHFSNPSAQRMLKDKGRQWERVSPSEPCEVADDTHICTDDWCHARQEATCQ